MSNCKALNYNKAILDKLKVISKPLLDNSCITSFRYFRVLDNNSYMNLSTEHGWLEERLTKIPNNGSSFHKPLCEAKKGELSFFLWEKDKNDSIVNLLIRHNIFNGITAYRRDEKSVEAWAFGATLEDSLAPNFYINNLDFLKSFIHHFNDAAEDIIDVSDTSRLACFSEKVSIISPSEKRNSPSKRNFSSNLCTLSKREYECLKDISKGKTFKETARSMKISPRTVESHVSGIKRKLGLTCKSEIIKYYWDILDN